MPFVPATRIWDPPGTAPTRTVLVLHGLLGSKRNWASMAKKMAKRWKPWRVVTLDLRGHGGSTGAPGPHTLAACARDLAALSTQYGWPQAVIGHSLGGAVALRYAMMAPQQLHHIWVLDTALDMTQGALAGQVAQVLRWLHTVPEPLANRAALAQRMQSQGFSTPMQQWMNTNLRRSADGYRWTFDLACVSALFHDLLTQSVWPALEHPTCRVHLVRAERSERWSEATLARIRRASPHTQVHTLADAGHWVHVDNPEGLLKLMDIEFKER